MGKIVGVYPDSDFDFPRNLINKAVTLHFLRC